MTAIDGLLRDAVNDGVAAGVTAVAVNGSGVSYLGAAGLRDLATGAPMTPDTVVRIASMTKAITSLAAMQQVERGALALDAPIGGVLPALHEPPVLDGFDAGGRPRLRPPARPVTLRHLLTHTSGLAYPTWNASLLRYRQVAPVARPVDGPDLRLSLPLAFDPGERWEYGTSTDWAGFAVERSAGQTLGDFLQGNVFAPLGLRDTAFAPADPARLATVYRRDAGDALLPLAADALPRPAFHSGGGGLFSTAADYGRMLQALLGTAGVDLVSPATLGEMHRDQIGEHVAGRMTAVERDRSNDVAMFPDERPGWSLFGLVNRAPVAGGRAAGSVCWGGLFNSYFWVDRAQGVAGAVFTQTLPFYDARIVALYEDFERLVYAGA